MGPAIEYAFQNGTGIFSVLFVCLLAWVLKTNNEREKRLQAIIEENQRFVVGVLQDVRGDLEDVKGDVQDIKQWMQGRR